MPRHRRSSTPLPTSTVDVGYSVSVIPKARIPREDSTASLVQTLVGLHDTDKCVAVKPGLSLSRAQSVRTGLLRQGLLLRTKTDKDTVYLWTVPKFADEHAGTPQ